MKEVSMKKRLLAWLLTVTMIIPALVLPAGAASTTRFSDISNPNTAVTIETLRLMGVLDGYSDGTFRPDGKLTRAQFCKMAAYMMDALAALLPTPTQVSSVQSNINRRTTPIFFFKSIPLRGCFARSHTFSHTFRQKKRLFPHF